MDRTRVPAFESRSRKDTPSSEVIRFTMTCDVGVGFKGLRKFRVLVIRCELSQRVFAKVAWKTANGYRPRRESINRENDSQTGLNTSIHSIFLPQYSVETN